MKKSKCALGISISQTASPGGMRMNRFYYLFIVNNYKKIFPWLCPSLPSSSTFLRSLKVSPRWMAVRCLTHTPRLVCSLPPLLLHTYQVSPSAPSAVLWNTEVQLLPSVFPHPLIHFFNWLIVFLQCCVGFRCTSQWFSYIILVYIFPLSVSSIQSLSRVWLLATPWIAAPQASVSITYRWLQI